MSQPVSSLALPMHVCTGTCVCHGMLCVCSMIMESEQRRREMTQVYNSYRAARSQYAVEDIPMPDSIEGKVWMGCGEHGLILV